MLPTVWSKYKQIHGKKSPSSRLEQTCDTFFGAFVRSIMRSATSAIAVRLTLVRIEIRSKGAEAPRCAFAVLLSRISVALISSRSSDRC